MPATLKRKDLLYPELSYQIVGILFEVFNELGYRYQEKYYQKAISQCLKKLTIPFDEQISISVKFHDVAVGIYRPDFLIDNKIVLEIKRGDYFSQQDIKQLLGYLEAKKLKLGILARFSSRGLKFKRIVNIK
jgi:GxxExxY protein